MQIFPTNRARDKRRKIIFHRSNRRMPTPSPVWDNEPKRDNSRCSRRSKRAISTTLPWHSLLFCATMSVIIIKSQSTSLFAFTMWLPPTVRRYMSDSVNVELFFFFGFLEKLGACFCYLVCCCWIWCTHDKILMKNSSNQREVLHFGCMEHEVNLAARVGASCHTSSPKS